MINSVVLLMEWKSQINVYRMFVSLLVYVKVIRFILMYNYVFVQFVLVNAAQQLLCVSKWGWNS